MLELSVNIYLKSQAVCDVVLKIKEKTKFLRRSGHRLTNLKGIQRQLVLEETTLPKFGNYVCWSYTHQGQEWVRNSQPAILRYDVTHGYEEGHNDGAYSDSKLHHNEWKLNSHSVCVTHRAAEAVRCFEGTKYVTISLVLLAIYKLFGNPEK